MLVVRTTKTVPHISYFINCIQLHNKQQTGVAKPVKTEVHSPIKIILASMDKRSTSRMDTIFKIIFKGRCQFALNEDAHLGIVDLDGEIDAWKKYQQQHPGLPTIVMSETPTKIEGAVYVAKPAKLDLLWESIFDLVTGLPSTTEIISNIDSVNPPTANDSSETSKKLDAETTGINAAAHALDTQLKTTSINLKSIQQTGIQSDVELYYNPDNYLLGRILSSLKKNARQQCILHVQCWRNRRLILFPDQDRAYSDLTDSQLKNLGVATLSEEFTIEINRVCNAGKKELPTNEIDGLRSMSINHLIWNLTLRTARGRVPEGTDLSMPFYLHSWPNFPRLPHTPHGMRIASLWAGNPRTLGSIVQSLDIDQTDVYSFYSAAVTTGLTGSARRQVDSLIAPKEVMKDKATRRGLLASILRRINKQ